jgi:hypothetical protein
MSVEEGNKSLMNWVWVQQVDLGFRRSKNYNSKL